MPDRLPIGVDLLDRRLGGGFPAGSIVAYGAAPASQSELLLYELAATRETMYLTTQRSREAVRDSLSTALSTMDGLTIRDVGGREPLDEMNRLVRTVPEGTNLIIDPVDILERRDHTRYMSFLNDLQTHMANTQSLTVLHCLTGSNVPQHRDTTYHVADVVLELETYIDGSELETRLSVPKFRGGQALTETIKLDLSDRVAVDTSRDIA